MVGKIIGTGSSVPKKVWSNDDIATMVETSHEWIWERTGIARRHIIEDETTVSMAAAAARQAIRMSGIEPQEIDLIIVATTSSNVVMPNTACAVQKEIGAIGATAFDLNAACSGFVYSYNVAQSYIQTGLAKTALIIGAESLSNLVNWSDRGTCILFGDGAGAMLLKADESERPFVAVSHSDGEKGQTLSCISRNQHCITDVNDPSTFIQMDGQGVFRFAIRKVPEVINEVLEKGGINKDEISYFILHQANRRIVEAVSKKLGCDMGKFPLDIEEYGNTSAASIPILFDQMVREEKLKRGMKLIISGFGAGLTWGATYLEY